MRIAANVILALYLLFLPLLAMLLPDYEVIAWSVFLLVGSLCAFLSGWGGRSVRSRLQTFSFFWHSFGRVLRLFFCGMARWMRFIRMAG